MSSPRYWFDIVSIIVPGRKEAPRLHLSTKTSIEACSPQEYVDITSRKDESNQPLSLPPGSLSKSHVACLQCLQDLRFQQIRGP